MSNNIQKDLSGRIYVSPTNQPANYGTQVQIPNGHGGYTQGTMLGGYVVPNKK